MLAVLLVLVYSPSAISGDEIVTKLLDRAIEVARRLPADEQDDVARALMGIIEVIDLDDIEPEHRAAVLDGLAQARRGEFATDEEVSEAFSRFGR